MVHDHRFATTHKQPILFLIIHNYHWGNDCQKRQKFEGKEKINKIFAGAQFTRSLFINHVI